VFPPAPRALFGLCPPLLVSKRPSPPHLVPLILSSTLCTLFYSISDVSSMRRGVSSRAFFFATSTIISSSSSSSSSSFSVSRASLLVCVLYAMLFHAWPAAGNRKSYQDYVHPECTHHRPSAPLLETTLFSSLRDAVKSFRVELLQGRRGGGERGRRGKRLTRSRLQIPSNVREINA